MELGAPFHATHRCQKAQERELSAATRSWLSRTVPFSSVTLTAASLRLKLATCRAMERHARILQ